MKKKILFISLIIIIMALMVVFGFTNGIYYFTALMNGDLGYHPTLGQISLYNPEWVDGYSVTDDGDGLFIVPQIPMEYQNIHYIVTNKVAENINEEEIQYYIRIVAQDGSTDMPIEYDVHEYSKASNVYPIEAEVGYGPFTLNANEVQEQKYSIKVKYKSYTEGIQYFKVQMITKKNDGTLKIISEAPLNMQYTGYKVRANLYYYLHGTNIPVGTSQHLDMQDNFTIDFMDQTQLNDLGIIFPEGYDFHDARSILNNWVEAQTITIPEGGPKTYTIEVYMTSPDVVGVLFRFYDHSELNESGNENLIIKDVIKIIDRGTTIDFTNSEQLSNLEMPLPTGYILEGLNGSVIENKMVDKSVTFPSTYEDASYIIYIYMNPEGVANVNLKYYEDEVNENNILDTYTQTLTEVPTGTTIDFTNSDSLASLKITLPEGYKFSMAYCTSIDPNKGFKSYKIPYSKETKTYDIDVVVSKLSVTATFAYFFPTTSNQVERKIVKIQDNFTIDFTDDNQLSDLGISMPQGYCFRYAQSGLSNWGAVQQITIPDGATSAYIEILLNTLTIDACFNFYDYTNYTVDEAGNKIYNKINEGTNVTIDKGTTIDFKNLEQLSSLGITLPENYVLQGLGGDFVANKFVDTSVTIQKTSTNTSCNIDIYMNIKGVTNVNLLYYHMKVDENYTLGTQTISIPTGTTIDFTDSTSLANLGITLPEGYEFSTAYCSLDSTGAGNSSYTIPYSGKDQTFDINVVLVGGTIKVPVKFCKDGLTTEVMLTTVEMDKDGKYIFNTEKCIELCPDLYYRSSFTVYIRDSNGNISGGIGNTKENGDVEVDYNATYRRIIFKTNRFVYLYNCLVIKTN